MTPHEIVRRIHAHAFGRLDRCQGSASITAVDVHINRMPFTDLGDDVSAARRDSRRDRRHRAEPGEAHHCILSASSFQLPAYSFAATGCFTGAPAMGLPHLGTTNWELGAGNW